MDRVTEERVIWVIEVLLPGPGMSWQTVPTKQAIETEEEADRLTGLYHRAMPMKEYRKTSYAHPIYQAEGVIDDDIPF